MCRKYYSVSICIGVTSGFAGVKLSGSPRMQGSPRVCFDNSIIMIANVRMSVAVKCGLNGILSLFLLIQDYFRFILLDSGNDCYSI